MRKTILSAALFVPAIAALSNADEPATRSTAAPDASEPTAVEIDYAARLATDYLENHLDSEGRFVYSIDTSTSLQAQKLYQRGYNPIPRRIDSESGVHTIMTVEILKARDPMGDVVELRVNVSDGPPWRLQYQDLDGNLRSFSEQDLFKSMQKMREELETRELQILCAGARPDVWPSGMSRDMGGGRKAYVMRIGKHTNAADLIDIFQYASPESVGTVQQQREYFQLWFNSLVQPLPGEIQEAKRHPNGWVYRIAGSFNDNEKIPPEAIVGAWKVGAGGDIEGQFVRNENYDPIRWPSTSKRKE